MCGNKLCFKCNKQYLLEHIIYLFFYFFFAKISRKKYDFGAILENQNFQKCAFFKDRPRPGKDMNRCHHKGL